jgi:Ca2+/Na+ antiporter
MYKACLCTMIRRQRTKDRQYVQGISMYNGQKIKNEGQTISLYICMPCTYCLSFVLCLLIIVHRYALYILFVLRSFHDQKTKNEGQTICTRHTYVQWSEDKERRTNNMYKACLCTMIRRQRTKDKQYVPYCLSFVLYLLTIIHRYALYILFVLRSLSSDHCT